QFGGLVQAFFRILRLPRFHRGVGLHDQRFGDLAEACPSLVVVGVGFQRGLELRLGVVVAGAGDLACAQVLLALVEVLVALRIGGTVRVGDARAQRRQLRIARQQSRQTR